MLILRWRKTNSELAQITGAAICTIGLVLASSSVDASLFRPYFGAISPALAAVAVAAVGIGCAGAIGRWRSVTRLGIPRQRWLRPGVVATLLAAVTIATDIAAPFPRDINVPLPEALLFYPAMGFVAEVAFHLAPLTIFVLVHRCVRGESCTPYLVWAAIGLVALIEPTFQILAGQPGSRPTWAVVLLGVDLFALSCLQLIVYLRAGFLAMYAVRMVYYVHWHFLWGHVRLDVLFQGQ